MTPSFSICHNHGYLRGEVHICPDCKEPTEVYSRIVGYLRSVSQWNEGKRAEFDMREHYSVDTKLPNALKACEQSSSRAANSVKEVLKS